MKLKKETVLRGKIAVRYKTDRLALHVLRAPEYDDMFPIAPGTVGTCDFQVPLTDPLPTLDKLNSPLYEVSHTCTVTYKKCEAKIPVLVSYPPKSTPSPPPLCFPFLRNFSYETEKKVPPPAPEEILSIAQDETPEEVPEVEIGDGILSFPMIIFLFKI